jgi:hypothetical protein
LEVASAGEAEVEVEMEDGAGVDSEGGARWGCAA